MTDQENKLHQVVHEVARGLYEVVRPGMGRLAGRRIVGEAASGDHTYALDQAAEHALEPLVRAAGDRHGVALAYYSEDRGLVAVHEAPAYVLIVDPIDGTRPAVCGFESCCVSVAAAPMAAVVPLGSVRAACLIELGTGRGACSQPPGGVGLVEAFDAPVRSIAAPSTRSAPDGMFWAYEVCGRLSEGIQHLLGRLIDQSSHAGGCFVFNSSSYAISRTITGQLDCYIDAYAALVRGPGGDKWAARAREQFGGRLFGLFPYDIAAAAHLARLAGCFVSDAHGRSLDDINLLDSSENGMVSIVVAGNRRLGEEVVLYLRDRLS